MDPAPLGPDSPLQPQDLASHEHVINAFPEEQIDKSRTREMRDSPALGFSFCKTGRDAVSCRPFCLQKAMLDRKSVV